MTTPKPQFPKAPTTQPQGFTLLEIIVAGAVFATTMVVAVGLFTSVTRVQKKVQSLSKVQGDARFALELMSQSVRVDGIDYSYYLDSDQNGTPEDYAPPLATSSVPELVTKGSDGTRRIYRGENLGVGRGYISLCVQSSAEAAIKCTSGGPGPFESITPDDIDIDGFKVWIDPASDPFAVPSNASDCKGSFDSVLKLCTCNDTAGGGADDDIDDVNCFSQQRCVLPGAGLQESCQNVNRQPRARILIESVGGSNRAEEQQRLFFQTTVASRVYAR